MKGRIYNIVQEHGFLNGYQVCRLLNGRGKDEFSVCYFTFQEKPKGTKSKGCRGIKTCKFKAPHIWKILQSMKNLVSIKIRARDKGGIKSDVFRYYALEQDILNEIKPFNFDPAQTTFTPAFTFVDLMGGE